MGNEQRPKYRFLTYHPFTTYAGENRAREFLGGTGGEWPERIRNGRDYSGAGALFRLGERAYGLLPAYETKDDFDLEVQGFDSLIDELRQSLYDQFQSGRIIPVSSRDESEIASSVALDADDSEIVRVAWALGLKSQAALDEDVQHLFLGALCVACLIDIDFANIGGLDNSMDSVARALSASEAFFSAEAIQSHDERLQQARKQIALQGALSRLQKDPRQQEKVFIYQCWLEWQAEPKRYASKAAFARDMRDKCTHLQSTKKIEDWTRDWEKGVKP